MDRKIQAAVLANLLRPIGIKEEQVPTGQLPEVILMLQLSLLLL